MIRSFCNNIVCLSIFYITHQLVSKKSLLVHQILNTPFFCGFLLQLQIVFNIHNSLYIIALTLFCFFQKLRFIMLIVNQKKIDIDMVVAHRVISDSPTRLKGQHQLGDKDNSMYPGKNEK